MVSLTRFALGFAVLSAVGAQIASAQFVISAQSGLIHYTEGKVFLDDQLIESRFGQFPRVKDGQQLRTADGRAEVLLTPGMFLRLGENSAVGMVTGRLTDTRLEFIAGEALVQVDELLDGDSVTVAFHDYAVHLLKTGIYRLTTEPQELRVYRGEASVDLNGEIEMVKDGRALAMDGGFRLAKFDKRDVDDLYKWSRRRSEYLAMANVSSAKTLLETDPYGYTPQSGWFWNPFFGMYTYVPLGGVLYDPFGFAFWSPYTVDSYLTNWGYYPVSGSGSSSGGSSGTGKNAHHPPARVRPKPAPGHGNAPSGAPRGVSVAASAHQAVSAGSGAHASGFTGSAGRSVPSGFSSGASSAGFARSSSSPSGSNTAAGGSRK